MAAGNTTSRPRVVGLGQQLPEQHAQDRGGHPGHEGEHGRDDVRPPVVSAERPEGGHRQGERLVREDVCGRARSRRERPANQGARDAE